MRWRLFMFPSSARWLEYPGPEELEANPDQWGLELPEGARVHSIQPLERRTEPLDDYSHHRQRQAVSEWAIFVAVPVDEGPA